MYKAALKAETFELSENKTSVCIWCLGSGNTNKAHIISEKLIKKNTPQNILSKSVCINCNSKWGKIEEWLLKKSPLTLYRILYHRAKSKGLKEIPQFYYMEEISNWLAIYRTENGEMINYQQILFKNNEPDLFVIGEGDVENKTELYHAFINQISGNKTIISIDTTLPNDFSDRIIIKGQTNIIVCKTKGSSNMILSWIRKGKYNLTDKLTAELYDSTFYNNLTMQFMWNDKVWEIYCIKLFFEFLAKHKSSEYCLLPSFNMIRKEFANFTLPTRPDIDLIILDEKLSFLAEMKQKSFEISFSNNSRKQILTDVIVSGDISVYYEIKNSILHSKVRIGFCPLVNIEIGIQENTPNELFYSFYRYEDADFFNIRLSETWDKNRMLLFSPNQNEEFSDYPQQYRMLVPIRQKNELPHSPDRADILP